MAIDPGKRMRLERNERSDGRRVHTMERRIGSAQSDSIPAYDAHETRLDSTYILGPFLLRPLFLQPLHLFHPFLLLTRTTTSNTLPIEHGFTYVKLRFTRDRAGGRRFGLFVAEAGEGREEDDHAAIKETMGSDG